MSVDGDRMFWEIEEGQLERVRSCQIAEVFGEGGIPEEFLCAKMPHYESALSVGGASLWVDIVGYQRWCAENEVEPACGIPRRPAGITLGEVARQAGISMETAQRYKKLYGDRLPGEGEGRSRPYLPEAVQVIEEIKAELEERKNGETDYSLRGRGDENA